MASISQHQKLVQIQRSFRNQETLEATVAAERLSALITKTEQLLRQKAFLREEKRGIRVFAEEVEAKETALQRIRRHDWIPRSLIEIQHQNLLKLSLEGMMFEIPYHIVSRDQGSLLCALISEDPPISPDEDRIFHFENDWWLFRYIVMFLRDGFLPNDRMLLSQLYREALFWNLIELRRAIEDDKLHLRDSSRGESENKWWKTLPSWLQAVKEEKKEEPVKKEKSPEDWWKGTSYKGKSFLLSEKSGAKP